MALVPISVFAAGLGKLNVMSGLGEPLKADIELISVTPEELSSITAAIASDEAYATQGIEKPASHNTIKVDIAKNADGVSVLKLKSAQPISEPFLDMLIQVDWASGRLLREYTVLLDPPGYTGETDPNAQAAQTMQAPIVSLADSTATNSSANGSTQSNQMVGETMASPTSGSKKTSKRSKKPVEVAVASEATGQEHLTQSGDTLAKIARDMKPEGVSLEQMLVGLYQTNPDAFQGANMNRLKVGQIIRSPSEDALNAISRNDASKEIKVQTTDWNAYRNKLAGMVADAASADTEANTQSAGGKIKTAAEDKSMPAAAGPKDVIKLSAGDASATKADAANVKSLQDKITALQEEATAREKSVKEAQDRTASLEKQIADMQKLLAMKNGAMADLQKQAEAQATAVPVKPEAEKSAEVVTIPAEPAKPVETAKAVDAAKPDAKPIVKPAPTTKPVPESSFISSILDGLDWGILAPAGGLLALLAGGWMYLRKKQARSLADFEQGIMTSGGLKANTVFGNTASASVDTGDTSFLTDFSQSGNGGMIDTNDVDPIAEAEVYMAYGRDAQAEEILKDAISKEPKRHELHLKLLEMYAASKNVSAFETIAGELYTTLGAEDPTWAKVAEIGIKLEPSNPLYQANSSPTRSGESITEKLDATDFSNSPLAAEKDLDFSFDNDSLVQDFASTDTVAGGVATAADAATENVSTSDALSLDMGSLESETTKPDLAEPEPFAHTGIADDPMVGAGVKVSGTVDNSTMDFDMGDLGSFKAVAPSEEPIKAELEEFGHTQTMPGLDIPTFAAPQFMPEGLSETTEAVNDQVNELPKLDAMVTETFEFPLAEESQAAGVLDMSGMTTNSTEAQAGSESNFNFNVNTIQPDVASFKDEDFSEANAFDLTTINLDLTDSAETDSVNAKSESSKTEKPSEAVPSVDEPIEVETKLDLVVAYIEMDDKEGAKELLDEVMKEGGTKQRKRAEELMAKLA